MSAADLAERLAAVQARVRAACAAAGRDPGAVRLLAASKTRTPEEILAVHAAGQALFGENRAQELRDKGEALAGEPGIEWHFIGHLQRNKARYVVGRASMVHSVDSLDLARDLADLVAKRCPDRPLAALIEVNVGGEESKGGVSPAAALDLARAVAALPQLRLRGLMCVPPYTEDPAGARPYFDQLAALAAAGRAAGLALEELSMGMSHDLEVAIAAGATIVRVGTDIFGPRSYAI